MSRRSGPVITTLAAILGMVVLGCGSFESQTDNRSPSPYAGMPAGGFMTMQSGYANVHFIWTSFSVKHGRVVWRQTGTSVRFDLTFDETNPQRGSFAYRADHIPEEPGDTDLVGCYWAERSSTPSEVRVECTGGGLPTDAFLWEFLDAEITGEFKELPSEVCVGFESSVTVGQICMNRSSWLPASIVIEELRQGDVHRLEAKSTGAEEVNIIPLIDLARNDSGIGSFESSASKVSMRFPGVLIPTDTD